MANIFDLFKKIESTSAPASTEPISYIVAGLGNPDAKYRFTRHNAGFLALEYLSQKENFKIDRSKFKALVGEARIGGKRVLLIKPQTYMNHSGEAVREAADFYKIAPENITVICDDINLAPGKLRIRKKGSDGGQRGLRSIIEQLGTDAFPRVRMGVGAKPHPEYDLADWVLGEIPKADQPVFFEAMGHASESIEMIISGEIDKAMSKFN